MVVQARFAPSESLDHVRQWLVADVLAESFREQCFELSPAGPAASQPHSDRSLLQLGLVPAALLRLRWTPVGEPVTEPGTGTVGTRAVAVGAYLQDELALAADGKRESSFSNTEFSFPKGLGVGSKTPVEAPAGERRHPDENVSQDKGGATSEPKTSATGKPKWLKI